MQVRGTERAAAVVERVRGVRSGRLTITIGTGCCESTAPFLYEDFWPGPDQEVVGEVAGVTVYAPEMLRAAYRGDDGVVIDVIEERVAESLSIETEFDCRFILRSGSWPSIGDGAPVIDPAFGVDRALDAAACPVPGGPEDAGRSVGRSSLDESVTTPTVATGGPSRVIGELPEGLRRLRLR